MNLSPKTALGRPLDPSYKTNLAIIVVTLLVGVIAGGLTLLSTGNLGSAVSAGLLYGAIAFAGWVISREIDPDHDLSAFVAVALALIASLIIKPTSLDILPLALIIFITRMTSRVVGPRATFIDSAIVLATIGLTAYFGNLLIALVGASAFFLDGVLPNPLRRQIVFGVVAVGTIALVSIISQQAIVIGQLSGPYVALVAGVTIAFLLNILGTPHIHTQSDSGNRPLSLSRVRSAMLLTLAIGIAAAITLGDEGVNSLLPLWARLTAVPLYRLAFLAMQA